jgi:hypothetical protein
MDSRERDLEWDIVVDVSRANVTISFNAYDSKNNQNSDDKVVLPASPLEIAKWYKMSLRIEEGHLTAALEIEGRKLQTKKDLKIFENVEILKPADRVEFGRDLIGKRLCQIPVAKTASCIFPIFERFSYDKNK